MNNKQQIEIKVSKLRRIRRSQMVVDHLVRGVVWGCVPASVAIISSRLFAVPASEYILAGAALAITVAGFAVAGLRRKVSNLSVANDIDITLGLRERVGSALALNEAAGHKDPFVSALVKDAAKRVDQLPMRNVYPWRTPRTLGLAIAALAFTALLTLVPQINWFVKDSDRAEAKQIQTYGSQLKKLAEQVKKESERKKDPVLKQQASEIKKVGEKLDRGLPKKKDALKELQKLKDKLETQQSAQIPAAEKKLTSELGNELGKLKNTGELGELLQQGDVKQFNLDLQRLLQSLQSGTLAPAERAMLEDMLKAIEQTLKSEAAKDPQAQELAKRLKDLKDAASKAEQMRKDLERSLESFQQDLKQLTSGLLDHGMAQQAQQLNQLAQQMQQQMSQNGSMDQQTMEQMQEALKQSAQSIQNNSHLSQEQKQQLSDQNQKCQSYFQDQNSTDAQQSPQGQPSQSMQSQNQQVQQQMKQTGQQMQTQGDCMGGG